MSSSFFPTYNYTPKFKSSGAMFFQSRPLLKLTRGPTDSRSSSSRSEKLSLPQLGKDIPHIWGWSDLITVFCSPLSSRDPSPDPERSAANTVLFLRKLWRPFPVPSITVWRHGNTKKPGLAGLSAKSRYFRMT